MTESGERERALKLYEELDGIAREFDNYDFGLSYSDEPRDKSLAIITQFEQAAFEAGRGQELERYAKQLCEYCRDGVPFVDVDPAMAVNRGSFWHRNPIDPMVMSKCGAEAIRALPAPPDSGDAL